MAHIATLRKRAAALGLIITKCVDAYNCGGGSLYTLTRNENEHDNAEMLSLHGVAAELDRIAKESLLGPEGDDTLNARFAFNSSQTGTSESRVEWQRESARLYAKARESLFALVDDNRPAIDCPFNDMVNDVSLIPELRARITMERDISFAIIRAGLDAGYLVSIYDGEDIELLNSRSFVECARALFTTDENFIEFRKPRASGRSEYVGSVSLIYGNDGFDVVSDYSAPQEHYQAMKDFMRPIAELADKLESEL